MSQEELCDWLSATKHLFRMRLTWQENCFGYFSNLFFLQFQTITKTQESDQQSRKRRMSQMYLLSVTVSWWKVSFTQKKHIKN